MSCPVSGLARISINTIKPRLRVDPAIGTTIFLYDQTCTWTAEHLPPSVLNTWRELGDPVIDQFFEQYGAQLQDDEDTYTFLEQLNLSDDSYGDSCIVNFVKDIRQRPEWFDREQIERGQQFFLKHSPIASVAIFSYTLILGYGFPQLNDILIQTQYLSSSDLSQTYRRLLETQQMIIHAVAGDVDDFDQTFLDVVRVRLLHGMVRYKIKKYTRSNTAHIPINQEDSLITLLGFSYAVLQCMEERMNIPVSMEDKQAYMHLWRYIGWLIGIKDEFLCYLSSYSSTRIISESIFYHFYLPSQTSEHLVHHSLMAVYTHSTVPWSLKFFTGLSQRLIGQELSEALGIDQPVMDRLHRGTITVFFQIFRLSSRLIALNHPGINRWIIEATRTALQNVIREKLDNKLRNFSLFKSSKSAKAHTSEARALQDCPCGYYQKKQRGIVQTNDIGVFRITKPIASTLMLQSITFVFCLSLFVRWF